MRKVLTAISIMLTTIAAQAQTDPEYRAEIGAGAAMTAYVGDFNGNITKNMQPMGVLLGRYRFNPRMGLAMNIGYGKLKGTSEGLATWYPGISEDGAATVEFNNSLIDAGLRFEYNFWPYGTGREYRGAKRLVPYIALGLGATYVNGGRNSVFTANVPMGAGIKYKMGNRLNLGVEWAMHFSMNDKLDGVADPYGIKSNGMFKNTDCYSVLRLSVTYDIMAKCKTCNNDRD